MAKATRGKSIGNGIIELKKQAPGGMRKIRCPFCKKIAVGQRNAQGQSVVKCMCGREFVSQSF